MSLLSPVQTINFTVIPFFIAVNVVVNDTSKWTFGPEYTFKVNITAAGKYTGYRILQRNYTAKCRPKMSDRLFCDMRTMSSEAKSLSEMYENATEKFEIKFNDRSLKGLVIHEQSKFSKSIMDDLQKMASQLNKLVSHNLFYLRNPSMGNCKYEIIRGEETEIDTLWERDTDFRFVVLPLTEVKPGTTFWIENSQTECINLTSQDLTCLMEKEDKIGNFSSKIQISNRFEIFLTYDCNPVIYKEIVQISLDSVEPAQNALSEDEQIELNI